MTGTNPHSTSTSTVSEYLRILRRRRWLVLFAVILTPCAAVIVSALQKPTYQGTSKVLLSRQNLAATLQGVSDPSLQPADLARLAQTQAGVAQTTPVAQRVLKAADLHDRSPQDLLDETKVTPQTDQDILEIAVTDTDPHLAVKLANIYGTQFTEYRRELDTSAIERARQDVAARIAQIAKTDSTHSSVYNTLVDKEQQLRTLEALQTSNASVIDDSPTAEQVGPRTVRNGILGLIVGVLLGVSLAFLLNAVDTRIRRTEEIEEILELPLLGWLPAPPRSASNLPVMLEDPSGPLAEGYRILRTNIELSVLDEPGAYMVCSALTGEGKSTTSSNLAIAFARAGYNVILVDLDLRRPSLARMFALGRRPGLTDIALGRTTIDEALVDIRLDSAKKNGRGPSLTGSKMGRLRVLTSGPVPPDAGEFVGSPTLDRILKKLRTDADILIADTAPLLQVGDTLALSELFDAALLIVRANTIRRPTLRELRRTSEAMPTKVIGFAVSNAQVDEAYAQRDYYYTYGSRPAEADQDHELDEWEIAPRGERTRG